MKVSRIAAACLLTIIVVQTGCMMQRTSTKHGIWSAELSDLSRNKEKLPLAVSCVPKLTGGGTPQTTETNQWAYSALENAPFTINHSIAVEHDLVAWFNIQKRVQANALSAVGCATLFIVPGYIENTLEVSVDLRDSDDTILQRYRRSSSYNTWLGWIFVPWGLFVTNLNADMDVVTDMYRDIVREMYEDDYEFYRDYRKE